MRKLLLILLIGCAACTTQAQDPKRKAEARPPAAAPAASAPGDTLAQIRALAKDASCNDNGQCRSLPLGALACGGPSDYLAYSTLRANEKQMNELGERYKADRQAAIARSGEMSICRYMPDPGAVCVAGTCQLGAAESAR
ncbi:hypothetical protein [Massilia niastensis]|uniref:hypothetical protein n=1 Tax=Massilia niastensis TaxID=544911 RepID=UPI0003AB18A8|nr:hypothetical protein [Massilia niastensis]